MSLQERIIDAQHHFWDLAAKHRYAWLMKKGVVRFVGDLTPIQREYQVADFRADICGLPVASSVHVQVGVAPGDELAETLWLQEQYQLHGLPNAIIAFCGLTAPDLEAWLDAHKAAPALRGIRQFVGRSEAEDAGSGSGAWLDYPTFLAGLQCLARRGLTFDLQLIPEEMERAATLLSQIPDLRVALCHPGSLGDFSSDGIAIWIRGICRLSELPNFVCKLSGFGMFDKDWSAQSMRAQFDVLLAAFGPKRMPFASNLPVDKLTMSFADVWHRYFQLSGGLDGEKLNCLFNDTAAKFYRIPDV